MILAGRSRRLNARGMTFACSDEGSMLIEFSLSIWTLFLVTFLIFEFCMAVYTYSVLGNAAREGVRYAIVHGTDSSSCSGPSRYRPPAPADWFSNWAPPRRAPRAASSTLPIMETQPLNAAAGTTQWPRRSSSSQGLVPA
jgi:hypothetical protein